ncbi:initiation-specific alpha-1,6-mannosyltransferase [Monosporozyma unispora]|nr:membrane-bound alpha-1,6- mannosyltransferase Initiation-specific [Kazachstania unispora]
MNPLNKLVQKKKYRTVITAILILTIISYFHSTNKKLINQFNWQSQIKPKENKIILPTTSHNDKSINLKTFKFDSQDQQNDKYHLHDLREQLAFTFPYNPSKPIPRNVWQTWKNGPDSLDFPPNFKSFQKNWVRQSDWNYSLIKDDEMVPFLVNFYGEVPMVIEAFEAMPNIILKADFFRYLVLYARGGIYSDMDTFPLQNLNVWPSVNQSILETIRANDDIIPYKHKKGLTDPKTTSISNEPGFVIGIEADPDRPDWNDWYARRIQFCQWTIQSKPGHPVLRELIMNITTTTLQSVDKVGKVSKYKDLIDHSHFYDYNVNFRAKRLHDPKYKHANLKNSNNVDGTDIMNWTGPGIFSDIIFEYMNNLINTNNDIILQNANLEKTTSDDSENNEMVNNKSTKKFYKKIMESLQSLNIISWEFFSLITKPVIVDDIMVLPITSFSPGVNTMEAKDDTDPMAFVKHMFSGSWKATADGNAGND